MDLNNIELVRLITKVALNKYHSDRFDYTIDQLDLIRNDFDNTPCYYHMSSNATSEGKYASFNDGQMYIVIYVLLIQITFILIYLIYYV